MWHLETLRPREGMSLAQSAMASQGLDVDPQLPVAGPTPRGVQDLETPLLPRGPLSVEDPPCTPQWATLSFPSSLVRQAQAPFNLLKCGPWGCATLFGAAGLPAVLA